MSWLSCLVPVNSWYALFKDTGHTSRGGCVGLALKLATEATMTSSPHPRKSSKSKINQKKKVTLTIYETFNFEIHIAMNRKKQNPFIKRIF